MKQAYIFINSKINKKSLSRLIINKNDLLIGVDDGAKNILNLGLTPKVVVGDFDSLNQKIITQLTQKRVRLIKYPKDKDFTDSQIALDFAVKQKIKRVIFVGLTGNRLDHVLTNLFFIVHPRYRHLDISFLDNKQSIYIVKKSLVLTGHKNDRISLIPLFNNVTGIITSSLKFLLNNETLYLGDSRGINNVMTGSTANITIKTGLLMIIHQNS